MFRILDYGVNFSVSCICRGFSGHFFEDLQKIMVIGKPDLFRDLINLQRRVGQQPPGFLDPKGVHIIRERASGLFPEDLAEIGGIDMAVRRNLPERHAFPVDNNLYK